MVPFIGRRGRERSVRRVLTSVVLPTFNGERFVRRAVDSVLAQDHPELELLVIDDGSTDATPELVESISDSRVRLIGRPNGGVAAARNTGIMHAGGDAVAFIDQDDEWLPRKLSVQLAELRKEGRAMVGCHMRYVNADGRALGVAGEPTDGRGQDIAAASFVPFPLSAAVAWLSDVRAVGGFDESLVQMVAPVDDLDLMSRLAGRGRFVTLPEVLGLYRIHGSSGTVERFFAMQTGTEFLRARVQARAAGSDLTWEEFAASYRRSFARRRAEYTRYLYRTAGLSVAGGHRVRGAGYLAAAAALGPKYTLRRLRRQRARA
jgi:glycosyltransferase involved in cell wall biosynthesis